MSETTPPRLLDESGRPVLSLRQLVAQLTGNKRLRTDDVLPIVEEWVIPDRLRDLLADYTTRHGQALDPLLALMPAQYHNAIRDPGKLSVTLRYLGRQLQKQLQPDEPTAATV